MAPYWYSSCRYRLSMYLLSKPLLRSHRRNHFQGNESHKILHALISQGALSELTESFNKGRVASPPELKGTWVEIGNFDNAIRPHYRSLNCTGIRRGKKFEFAIIGVGYEDMIEVRAIGYRVQRVKLELDHKGNAKFFVDLDADGAEDLYTCRLTRRGTLACLDATRGPGFKRTDATGGGEFKRMKVADSQLFNGLEP